MLRLIAAFRALKINLFHDVEWSVSCVHMGREWPDLGGLALCHMQRSPTRRDPYLSLPVLGSHRKTDTAFITLLRKTLIGDIIATSSLAAHLAVCPLSLSCPTTTSGHQNEPQPSTNTQWRSTVK